MPTNKTAQTDWLHPSRLPLGGGWDGHCTAPGHVGEKPDERDLREGCNLGYASRCTKRPAEHIWDSVRFAVEREYENRVLIVYVCEKDHRPETHGVLEFDSIQQHWTSSHQDGRIQKMAECYMQSYFEKRKGASDRTVAANANE
jgi:hypothetical protein